MYHLTRYRYWFFLISGVVIIPGLLALIFWHLNLGIDFTNGTTVSLRFANNGVTTAQVQQVFRQAGAQDAQVYASHQIGSNFPHGQYVYITFSRPIGPAEEDAVKKLLADQKYGLPSYDSAGVYSQEQLGVAGQQPYGMMIFLFESPVKESAVQTALAKLPPTDLPVVATSPTPTAKSTATTKASATGTATGTPATTATPAATATPTASGGTFPVSVTKITLGQNSQIYEVDTQTFYSDQSSNLNSVISTLNKQYGPVYKTDLTSVGPAIASETTFYAFLAVLVASLAILIYIGIAFRHVGSLARALRFGASAIIALLHDVLVVLGLWAIFGHFFNFKVDSLFLTAVLTVIGFSVHDTIVVFDRIRENLARRTSESFQTVVDTSLVQTLSRSLNTSLTVIFTLAALTLFGGASIQQFTLALLIGIASGTFSSIFNASMILVVWETREYRNWFKRGGVRAAAQTARPRNRQLAGTRA